MLSCLQLQTNICCLVLNFNQSRRTAVIWCCIDCKDWRTWALSTLGTFQWIWTNSFYFSCNISFQTTVPFLAELRHSHLTLDRSSLEMTFTSSAVAWWEACALCPWGMKAQPPELSFSFWLCAFILLQVTLETTIGNSNPALWKMVTPNGTVFEWLRNIVANRLATNGLEWADIFQQWNSGTWVLQTAAEISVSLRCHVELTTLLRGMGKLFHCWGHNGI